MAYDVGYSAPGNNLVFAGTSSDDVPHILQGQWDGSLGGAALNGQINPRFDSVSALVAAYASIPDAQKPALAKVTGLGLYQWVPAPYAIWIPALGAVNLLNAPTRATQTVTSTSGAVGTTEQLVISVPKWPLLVTVTYRARVAQTAGSMTAADTYINFNGSADGYQTVPTFPMSTSVTMSVKVPGTADGGGSTYFLQGGLQWVAGGTGSSASVDGTDTPRTRLSAVISPFYANVGGTPF